MISLAVVSIHSISSAVSFLQFSSMCERNFPNSLTTKKIKISVLTILCFSGSAFYLVMILSIDCCVKNLTEHVILYNNNLLTMKLFHNQTCFQWWQTLSAVLKFEMMQVKLNMTVFKHFICYHYHHLGNILRKKFVLPLKINYIKNMSSVKLKC